jgi:uncharacterized protein
MTLFFPDVNVWLALSVEAHQHSNKAWQWMGMLPKEAKLVFCRYTHLGLLRLLTNSSVMGQAVVSLEEAWSVYDRWLGDARVAFYPEPRDVDVTFRQITRRFGQQPATKMVGDCWLLANAVGIGATLMTFDQSLLALIRKEGHRGAIPAEI